MAVLSRPEQAGAAEQPGDSLRDRLLEWRSRLVANPSFQRFATRFLPFRPIARRNASQLFDLLSGFVYSQVLLACVRLKLFDRLAQGPAGLADIARWTKLSEGSAQILLGAAESLSLVQRRSGERFGLGPLGAALRANPGLAAMIEHHAMMYGDLSDPVALLRGEADGTRLAQYWSYASEERPAGLDAARIGAYSSLMAASQPMIAEQVIAAWPFSECRCLLDVGGGEGAFVSAVAHVAPGLRGVVFDLPSVTDRASERFRKEGLSNRAVAIGGDFFKDKLPEGADVISLVRVLHDHDDDKVLMLLRNVRKAMTARSVLLIAEPMAEHDKPQRVTDAYFAFYFLCMKTGRPRSFEQLSTLLRAAGFGEATRHPTPLPMVASLVSVRPDKDC